MKITARSFASLNYKSIILSIIIFSSVLAFLFTGFGRLHLFNLKKMDPNTVLIVGNQKVDVVEFSNILRAQGFSNSLPENQKKYLEFQIINQLIQQKLILDVAQNLRFIANDSSIAAFIQSIPAFIDPATKRFSYERVKQYLKSQDINEIEFFQMLKNELSVQNVSALLFMSTPYPSSLAEDQYMIQNTAFQLQYALLNVDSGLLKQKAQSQVEEFLKDPQNITLLQAEFESKKAQFNSPAQFNVKSILVAYKGALRVQGDAEKRTKEEAQQMANALLERIQQGESFQKAAGQINDDLAAKNNKGSLGFVDEASIDSASYAALSKLTLEHPLSGVIETPYGFRLFQLNGKKEAVIKTFDDVKPVLAADLILQRLKDSEQAAFDVKVRAALTSSNQNEVLAPLLSTQNITWHAFDHAYTVSDLSVPKLGSTEQLAENVFVLKTPGDIIPKILQFGAEKHVLVKLVSIQKPNPPTQAEIHTLAQKISAEDAQQFFQNFMKDLRESYEKKGKIKINQDLISL